MGGIDVDVLVVVGGGFVGVDSGAMVVDVAGGINEVDVEPSEPAEVQALKTSNVATVAPTRNGDRVGPPKLIDLNRRLTGYPQIPCSRSNPTHPNKRALQEFFSYLIVSPI